MLCPHVLFKMCICPVVTFFFLFLSIGSKTAGSMFWSWKFDEWYSNGYWLQAGFHGDISLRGWLPASGLLHTEVRHGRQPETWMGQGQTKLSRWEAEALHCRHALSSQTAGERIGCQGIIGHCCAKWVHTKCSGVMRASCRSYKNLKFLLIFTLQWFKFEKISLYPCTGTRIYPWCILVPTLWAHKEHITFDTFS